MIVLGKEKGLKGKGKGKGRQRSIVLHVDAKDSDVLRSLLVYHKLGRDEEGTGDAEGGAQGEGLEEAALRKAEEWADEAVPRVQERLAEAGWEDNKFMFGSVRKRLEW